MKEITVKAYEFKELSEDAKKKAREWYRRASADYDFWSVCVIDEAVESGTLMGIEFKETERKNLKGVVVGSTPNIFWSGFWSQGDGACFEGTWRAKDVKLGKVAEGWGEDPDTTKIKEIAAEFERIAKAYPESSFTVKHSGHYSHENCTEFDFAFPDDNEQEDWPDGKTEEYQSECDALKYNAKKFMKWIYRRLEKEYEYQNADEQIDESIIINDYLFTEDGDRKVIL